MKKQVIGFDHHTKEWVENPFLFYEEMLDEKPLSYSEAHGGFWLLARYEDVRHALMNYETFSSAFPGRIAIPHTSPGPIPGIPIEVDPPKQTEYRAAVSPFFSKAAVKKLEPKLRTEAQKLMNRCQQKKEFELVIDYATPLLATAIGLFFNLSAIQMQKIEAWANAIFGNRSQAPEQAKAAQSALANFLNDVFQSRKTKPQNDLFTELTKLSVADKPLSNEELVAYGRILLLAGREATIDAISNSFWYLASHPDKQTYLKEHPETLVFAVEEFLRYLSPIQLLGRVTTQDVSLHNQVIPKGSSVAMTYACANRDERVFEQANSCLLERRPNPHLAFGAGPHYCLGAHLARLVIRIALEAGLEASHSFSLSEEH